MSPASKREGSRRPTPRLAALVLVLVVACAPALVGCGLGDKAARAALIIKAAERIEVTGARGTVSYVVEARGGNGGAAGPGALTPRLGPLALAVEPGEGLRLASVGPPVAGDPPVLLLDGPDLYLRVATATALLAPAPALPRAGGAADVLTRRPWARLGLTGLPARNLKVRAGTAVLPVHPAFLLRLARGTLTGSVRPLGTDRHFAVNVDREKAARGLLAEEREEQERALRSTGSTRTVFPAEVWIGADGSLQRLVVRIPQREGGLDRHTMVATIEVDGPGPREPMPVPAEDDVSDVPDFPTLIGRIER
jgi:hypothetical protein